MGITINLEITRYSQSFILRLVNASCRFQSSKFNNSISRLHNRLFSTWRAVDDVALQNFTLNSISACLPLLVGSPEKWDIYWTMLNDTKI